MMFSHPHQWRPFRPSIEFVVISWFILPLNSAEWRCINTYWCNVDINMFLCISDLIRTMISIGTTTSLKFIKRESEDLLSRDCSNHDSVVDKIPEEWVGWVLRAGKKSAERSNQWSRSIVHCHCSPPYPTGRPLVIVHGAERFDERLELEKCDRKVNIADPYNQVSRFPLILLSSICWTGTKPNSWG